ncbi:NUDIX domain-containing protein [Nesterenkonia sp.]|uniref:NUDIX hydrolase n=1 Tax=Nesterenkonia sp. TaxID=704201 RepID=UPI00261775A0|nr:NUDIX domain-containing protein [Nesterenkonia sp.]
MPTPEFILRLRREIGHKPLLLPGVTAVVIRRCDDGGTALETPEVLLVRRADSGAWSVTSGILEPGEQPGATAAREVLEETGVTAEPVRVAGVSDHGQVIYPNGDECWFTDITFEMRYLSGAPRVADDESTEVAWFRADRLPEPFTERHRERIDWALDAGAAARFR